MVKAYYNEHDKSAAAWLRELIKAGVITDGTVDERSIEDVVPAELAEFDRCHFFAGIGVWDYALTRAGWPDNRRVWTGSCPCQPFSAAGKGEGFADERHLWPAWFHLIEVCRPDTIFGEQVSSKDGTTWLDLVLSDLEGVGYAVGPLDIPAASVGAPHRRQRLYFVADASCGTGERRARGLSTPETGISRAGQFDGDLPVEFADGREVDRLERPVSIGRRGRSDGDSPGNGGEIQIEGRGSFSGVALGDSEGWRLSREQAARSGRSGIAHAGGNGPTNGFWRDAEWIWCRDEKYRPVEPGTFPLVTGAPARVGRLRGYGNAINAENAIAFIESYLDLESR